jgi:hypothetical protein
MKMLKRRNLLPKSVRARRVRCRSLMILAAGSLLCMVSASTPIVADEPSDIIRIEEDWEVVLNEPNEDVDAPQFHTLMAPFAHFEPFHFQISWNYRGEPDFVSGGMQVLAWFGESCIGQKSYREDKLSICAETITWTSVLETNGCSLKFEVINGASQTWGAFGGSETSLTGPIYIPNLNFYSTDFSAANSWISYGANRVDLLRIKEVRRYNQVGQLIARDTTPRVVYELDTAAIILADDEDPE